MKQSYADHDYESVPVENLREGWGGFELHCTFKGTKQLLAKIIFWDAIGQWMFETFETDIPLPIVEALIVEAKCSIKVR